MPDRETHARHSYTLARVLGLRVDPTIIPIIDRIIDSPHTLPRGILEKLRTCNDPRARTLAETALAGLRYSQALRHDWGLNRLRRGRSPEVLKSVVKCLYGDDAVVLVDLHSSLDMIHSRGMSPEEYLDWARVNGVDGRVIGYILSKVLSQDLNPG